jgi:hypothetical protein
VLKGSLRTDWIVAGGGVMTNFATSTDYDTYLAGKEAVIDTASFDYYARKATQLINQMTFNRITETTEKIKFCCCEVAESFYKQEQKTSEISSEKVGNYSVTKTVKSAPEWDSERTGIIRNWLLDTGLLYKGVY